ncbi:hypothetical protein [Deinococcus kurensis]|uniref:hypothetical protein n=1 Tax=Deinococcus kurensis TaxID=2662757 RepID=UPI0012D2FEEB|nr:hypothetical protein [Deinococcus kurensis]
MAFDPVFDYDQDLTLSSGAVMTHADAVRHITTTLPHNFYDRAERTLSLTSWLPWPGTDIEIVPDTDFEFYCTTQDAERVPTITSYHGHTLLMPVVRVEYLGRGRKFLRATVTFVRRRWDKAAGVSVTEEWLTVPAVQGDNNHLRLLEALPGETDLDLDQSQFFTETPEDMDLDFENRMTRAYGDVLAELV